MIDVKTNSEIEVLRQACQIAAGALKEVGKYVTEGVTTAKLNKIIHEYILSKKAKPSFLGYNGFPAASCISINNEVIHGIPSNKVFLKDGDLVSIDVGAYYGGFHGDNAFTYTVGEISAEAKKLIEVTQNSLLLGINQCKPNNRIGDISHAVQQEVENNGLYVVKKYVGHGIGKNLHESPEVPNFGSKGKGARLVKGMAICIEPMINIMGEEVTTAKDNWTILTKSNSLSAHFEHTVLITSDGYEVLTK